MGGTGRLTRTTWRRTAVRGPRSLPDSRKPTTNGLWPHIAGQVVRPLRICGGVHKRYCFAYIRLGKMTKRRAVPWTIFRSGDVASQFGSPRLVIPPVVGCVAPPPWGAILSLMSRFPILSASSLSPPRRSPPSSGSQPSAPPPDPAASLASWAHRGEHDRCTWRTSQGGTCSPPLPLAGGSPWLPLIERMTGRRLSARGREVGDLQGDGGAPEAAGAGGAEAEPRGGHGWARPW